MKHVCLREKHIEDFVDCCVWRLVIGTCTCAWPGACVAGLARVAQSSLGERVCFLAGALCQGHFQGALSAFLAVPDLTSTHPASIPSEWSAFGKQDLDEPAACWPFNPCAGMPPTNCQIPLCQAGTLAPKSLGVQRRRWEIH